MDSTNIVKNVSRLIAEYGMNVATVERMADLGNGTIRSWSEDSNMRIESLVKVAKVLNVTVDDLLREVE